MQVKILQLMATAGIILALAACGPTMTIKHEFEPIYVTVDINIKVQKELEEFFDFEKNRSEVKIAPAEDEPAP